LTIGVGGLVEKYGPGTSMSEMLNLANRGELAESAE